MEQYCERYYTIGIAGHIDHGKTTLTKTLTGVNTDRLKEEKERQISIELGFAPFRLPNGNQVGVVDVPGHERFIRQMIAGVAGIDMVLLVIAADEGIMPQTVEHMEILEYLGAKHGIVVVTKSDLVDQEWLEMVQEEIREWLKERFHSTMPIIPVSATTGAGMEELISNIQKLLDVLPGRNTNGPFRLPVDRVFTKKGIGTIVTGTVYQGKISEGDVLTLLPQGINIKVRQVHVHNNHSSVACAGQRTALNLAGIDREKVKRGDTLVSPGFFQSTTRVDIHLQMLPHLDFHIKRHSRVRLHVATSELIAKVLFFDRNELKPGEEVYAQLELEEPVVLKRGDPIIIRRLSPLTTIGGGRVIDPYTKKYKFGQDSAVKIKEKDQHDATASIEFFFQEVGFSTRSQATRHLAIDEMELDEWLKQAIDQGKVAYFPEEQYVIDHKWEQNCIKTMEQTLRLFHDKYPMRNGMKKAELKSRHFSEIPDKVWNLLLQNAMEENRIDAQENWVALAHFHPNIPDYLQAKSENLVSLLSPSDLKVMEWEEAMAKVGIISADGEDLKNFLVSSKQLIPLSPQLLVSRNVWEQAVERLRMNHSTAVEFSPGEAKDVLNISRKYLIPFLESLDAFGLTVRLENTRKWNLENAPDL